MIDLDKIPANGVDMPIFPIDPAAPNDEATIVPAMHVSHAELHLIGCIGNTFAAHLRGEFITAAIGLSDPAALAAQIATVAWCLARARFGDQAAPAAQIVEAFLASFQKPTDPPATESK